MAKMHNNKERPTDLKDMESASVVLICSEKNTNSNNNINNKNFKSSETLRSLDW